MSINNLTLAPSIVLDTDGSKIGVIVDGARYTGYDLAEVQEFMQDTITRWDRLIATERAKKKPNLEGIATLIKRQELLKQAISLLNPNGPADQAIKADEAAVLAARKAREAAAPPPPAWPMSAVRATPPTTRAAVATTERKRDIRSGSRQVSGTGTGSDRADS
jgi:hypothetical protein